MTFNLIVQSIPSDSSSFDELSRRYPAAIFLKGDVDQCSETATSQGGEGDEASDSGVQGHVDLVSFISKSCCECLNDSDDHPFAISLTSDARYLESDCDEQPDRTTPEDNGPKTLKLFINQPRTLDFVQADSSEPVQILELKPEDLTGENPVPFKICKISKCTKSTDICKRQPNRC
ncbi:thioredoxin-like protein 1 [Trichonephila clavipes]|nr:thioredoxin-like protein 1 [Trichonephila clavipes]